ncbi:aplysianin-A-like [Corticium candelabrum]|uniref:aplysianin-A-like n=1 Tax=Corticium candelabrum TaxID=121492 RepID=UPI002E26C324|nr:aplysianin-A-like [Corticium candelabrum]
MPAKRSDCVSTRRCVYLSIAAVYLTLCHAHDTNDAGDAYIEACMFDDNKHLDVQDIVIVGGGAAGTFAAWRLQHAKVASKIMLLEATNRIGGRLYSQQIPGIDYYVADLGGMRYLPDFQPYIKALVKELKLETKVFEMDSNNEEKPWFLRGRFFQQKDIVSIGNSAYGLRDDEKLMSPRDIVSSWFETLVPKGERSKPSDQMTTIFGDPLISYGLMNGFELVNMSSEAYRYVIDSSGFDPSYSNPNAAAMLPDLLPSFGDLNILTPVKGMNAIPKQMASNFTVEGGRIEMNTTVTDMVRCSLLDGTVYVLGAYNYVTGKNTFYIAKKVILALTKSQLKRIRWKDLETLKQHRLLDAVYSRTASKLILAFDQPWWRHQTLLYLNLTKGRSVSTLPTRQTFYFTPKTSDATNRSFIMIYNDGYYSNNWSPLSSTDFKQFGGSMSPVFPVSEVMLEEALRQIAMNHNTTDAVIGRPYFASFMMWNHALTPVNVVGYGPYMPSESWHNWLPGYNFTAASEAVMQLDPTWDVFICGEAYSAVQQSWTEGAIETADKVLTRFFNLSPFINKQK